MAFFRPGQEAPAQGLILDVVLVEGQRRDGLGHLVAEVERVGWIFHTELVEDCKGIFSTHEPFG